MLVRLALTCHRHRLVVALAWVALVVAGVLCAPALFGRLVPDAGYAEDSASAQADRLLWQAQPTGEEVYALVDGVEAGDPSFRAALRRTADAVDAVPGVAAVHGPWSDPAAVSDDASAVLVRVATEPTPEGESALHEAARLLRDIDAPRVLVGGGPLLDDEMEEQAAEDLARAEILTTPVVLVLLLVVFGGIVAAGLPVLVTLVGVAVTMLALLATSAVTDVSVYAVNVVTMLGLGLAVDYCLLVVSRYREELLRTDDRVEALALTLRTAGRTVLFSGLTVAASLSGLLVFEDPFLRSLGAAGLSVVLLDMLAALTLLPALLSLAGPRVRPRRQASRGSTFAHVARWVRRRPVAVLLVGSAALGAAALPYLGVRYADPDARSLPPSSESRQLLEAFEERFTAASEVDPVTVVLVGTPGPEPLRKYADALSEIPDVTGVTVRPMPEGADVTVLDVVPRTAESQGATAMRVVGAVRDVPAPAEALVTGDAAQLDDYQDQLVDRLPWALAVLLVLTGLLLFLFTGSVVLPVKAAALGTLSLGASFGALVWVFQDGNLGWLVGTEALGSLSVTTPVLVLAIAFGLSMDYEVFLLGRIREAYLRTGDPYLAVEQGLQRTGGVVTAAALLMVVVYAGFVAGGFSPVKQVGLGLVLAVAVDATLVRMLLLPATMTLLGRWAWWAPAPLRRLHDRIGLDDEVALQAPRRAPLGRPEGPVDGTAAARTPTAVR